MHSRHRFTLSSNSRSLWTEQWVPIISHIPYTAFNLPAVGPLTCPVPMSTHSSISVFMLQWASVQRLLVSCLLLCNTPALFVRLRCFLCNFSFVVRATMRWHDTTPQGILSLDLFYHCTHHCLIRSHAQSLQQGEKSNQLRFRSPEMTCFQDIETVDLSLASSLQSVNSSLATFAASVITVASVPALASTRSSSSQ